MRALLGALIVLGLVVGGAVGFTVWQAKRSTIAWHVGRGYRWTAFDGFDAGLLPYAIEEAEGQLSLHTAFDIFGNVSLIIRPEESWVDAWGRQVGGITQGNVSTIGQSLGSLAHELAHASEIARHGHADDSHSTWADAGIWDADREYREWLGEQ